MAHCNDKSLMCSPGLYCACICAGCEDEIRGEGVPAPSPSPFIVATFTLTPASGEPPHPDDATGRTVIAAPPIKTAPTSSDPKPPVIRCKKCKCIIERVEGGWVTVDPGFTSDGLGYCPPNPDARRVGYHEPKK